MVPPARKRWNPIQRGSVAKIEVSPQPECVLIKSRGKGERLSIPRELFATFRFFKRPSNRGGGIGKGGKKKERKERKKEKARGTVDGRLRERRMLPENSGARSPTGFPLSGIQRRGGFERPYLAMHPLFFIPPPCHRICSRNASDCQVVVTGMRRKRRNVELEYVCGARLFL